MENPRFIITTVILSLLLVTCHTFQQTPLQSDRCSRLINHALSSKDLSSGTDASASDTCPFSRTFPRYRIDLTRSSKKAKDRKQKFNLFGSFQQSSLRGRLERKYGPDLQWLGEHDDVKAFTELWQATGRVASGAVKSQIIALPDCDSSIILNWKELMEWIELNMPDQVRIKTSLVDDDQVVIIDGVDAALNRPSVNISPIVIEDRLKAWVKRMLVELTICPFTKSVTKSGQGLGDLGVPVGQIAYHTSASPKCVYQLLADTWSAMNDMLETGPSGLTGISSILLAAPAWDDDFDTWSGPFFCLLENCVVAAQAEAKLGVVCFHPQYATPDGTSWPGFGHMHSVPRLESWVKEAGGKGTPLSQEDIAAGGAWQRRTPHATINVLRADQLEVAESRRDTPKLYARNIKVLMEIGNDKLLESLERERSIGSS